MSYVIKVYFCHYFSFYHFSAILKKNLNRHRLWYQETTGQSFSIFFSSQFWQKRILQRAHIYHQDFSGSNYILCVDFCSEKERQQWLIALGSAKANQANRQRRQRISSTTSSSFGDSPNQAIPQLNRSNSTNSIGTSLLDNALTIGT